MTAPSAPTVTAASVKPGDRIRWNRQAVTVKTNRRADFAGYRRVSGEYDADGRFFCVYMRDTATFELEAKA